MKNTLETRLGIFFALALFVAVLVLEMVGAFDFFKGGYLINATFKNVQELKTGDAVKMAGVEIGRVEKIGLTNNLALVTIKIQNKYREVIRTDSRAAIKFTGLMGQNFVAIEGGTPASPASQPGFGLQTIEQPDLSALMTKLQDVATGVEGLTKSFDPKNLSSIVGPVVDFVQQNSPALTAMIGNMRTVSDKIVQGEGTVGMLINDKALYHATYGTITNLQNASGDLKGLLAQTDRMVQDARQILAQIQAGQGTVGRLVKDESLFIETTNAMANLRQILEKVNQGQGTAGKFVNDDSLFRNAKISLQKLEKATEGLEDQGPLTVLGIAVGRLF